MEAKLAFDVGKVFFLAGMKAMVGRKPTNALNHSDVIVFGRTNKTRFSEE